MARMNLSCCVRTAVGLGLIISSLPVTGTALKVTFDELPFEDFSQYWNGSDGSGGFTSKGVFFSNTYTPAWGAWSGFAYSRVNDTNTPGYFNQYAVFSGTGLGGTGTYVVAYDNGFGSATIDMPYPTEVRGVWVNNTTYAALDMLTGSAWSKKFGGPTGNDPDWFLLTISAFDAEGQFVGSNLFYLADYRFENNALDYIVSQWSWIDLTNLGSRVKSLTFALSSSDVGPSGMNTPAYFALDGVEFRPIFSQAFGDQNNPHDPGVAGFVGPNGDGAVSTNNWINPVFYAWATGCTSCRPAPGVDATWTNWARALGPATGDHFDIVSLGDLTAEQIATGAVPGEITLTFPTSFGDRPGPDFAVFENGFGLSNAIFAELAYVEVSSDGTNFARFPSLSLMTNAVGAYGMIDPREVYNLAGKHLNNNGKCWGTPFDLSDLADSPLVKSGKVDLAAISHVRLVDIPGSGDYKDSEGNPIYDSWVTIGSGGFDLEAVGLLRPAVSIRVDSDRLIEQGNQKATITITCFLAWPLAVPLRIGGTASNGSDYAWITNVVRFGRLVTEQELYIEPIWDGLDEGLEIITVEIVTNADFTVFGESEATVTIDDTLYADHEWRLLNLPARPESLWNYGTALAHLPDGRCIFGARGKLYLQAAWEGTNWIAFATPPEQNDPSCIAVWDDQIGILGAGGWSGASAIFEFRPDDTHTAFITLFTNYNFAAVFRDAGSLYLVGGDFGDSHVRLVSLNGMTNRVIIENVSTFSGGIAVDSDGALYVGDADDGKVYRFSRTQLDNALTGTPLRVEHGEFVCQFANTGVTNALGSLAIDGRGCVWAAGWNVVGLEMFDPDTAEFRRYVPCLSNANYTVAGFTREGKRYVAYVDLEGYEAGKAQYYGYVQADGSSELALTVPIRVASELGPSNGLFRVTRRSWDNSENLAISAILDGTASNGVDYVAVSDTVMIAAGQRRGEVPIQPLRDQLAEGTETVRMRLVPDATWQVWGQKEAWMQIEDIPFDAWRHAYFGASANSPEGVDDGDWDGDGLANLLEYVMGRSPTNPADGHTLLTVSISPTNGSAEVFSVTYERRKNLQDAGVSAEATSNLLEAAWSTDHVLETTMAANAETETVRATLRPSWSSGFIRLRAQRR